MNAEMQPLFWRISDQDQSGFEAVSLLMPAGTAGEDPAEFPTEVSFRSNRSSHHPVDLRWSEEDSDLFMSLLDRLMEPEEEGDIEVDISDGVIQGIVQLVALARSLRARAGAFVIACYSDPGLHAVREAVDVPVLGIMESGVLTALTLGQRFGVIAILPGSIPRHLRAYSAMGVQSRLAGQLAIGLNVTELADYDRTLARMREVGLRLRDTQGADVIVMGCAGMAVYRNALQEALGIPVVEPSQAAAAMAIGRIKMNWHGA